MPITQPLIAYIGPLAGGRGFEGRLGSEPPFHNLLDCNGNIIGIVRLTKSWPTPRSHISSRMWQAYATVQGTVYTGRTAGEGMIFKGKPIAKQGAK